MRDDSLLSEALCWYFLHQPQRSPSIESAMPCTTKRMVSANKICKASTLLDVGAHRSIHHPLFRTCPVLLAVPPRWPCHCLPLPACALAFGLCVAPAGTPASVLSRHDHTLSSLWNVAGHRLVVLMDVCISMCKNTYTYICTYTCMYPPCTFVFQPQVQNRILLFPSQNFHHMSRGQFHYYRIRTFLALRVPTTQQPTSATAQQPSYGLRQPNNEATQHSGEYYGAPRPGKIELLRCGVGCWNPCGLEGSDVGMLLPPDRNK